MNIEEEARIEQIEGAPFIVVKTDMLHILDAKAVIVYSIIRAYWAAELACPLTNTELANKINVNRRTIGRIMHLLEEKKLISTIYQEDQGYNFRFIIDYYDDPELEDDEDGEWGEDE